MLLARFRVSLAAYQRLKVLLPAPLIPRNGSETKSATSAPPYGDDAPLLSTDSVTELSSPAQCEESSTWTTSSKPAKPAELESRIVLWALKDAAACVVQEETRRYARRRRSLSAGFGPQQGTPSTMDSTDMEEEVDEENEDGYGEGYQPAVGQLPWVIGAPLPTTATTTTTRTATTASSSTRVPTTRSTAAAGTATTASSAARRAMGSSRSSDLRPIPVSTSPATDRFSLSAASVLSPSWQSLRNAGTSYDNHPDTSTVTELQWSPEVESGDVRSVRAEEKELGGRVVNEMAAIWPLLPSEERKKR